MQSSSWRASKIGIGTLRAIDGSSIIVSNIMSASILAIVIDKEVAKPKLVF